MCDHAGLSCRVYVVDPYGDDRLTFVANLVQFSPGRYCWQYEVKCITVYCIYHISQSETIKQTKTLILYHVVDRFIIVHHCLQWLRVCPELLLLYHFQC